MILVFLGLDACLFSSDSVQLSISVFEMNYEVGVSVYCYDVCQVSGNVSGNSFRNLVRNHNLVDSRCACFLA